MGSAASSLHPSSDEWWLGGHEPASERPGTHDLLDQADAAVREHRYADAVALLEPARPSPSADPRGAVRAFFTESWALMCLGRLDEALNLLERARGLVESRGFSDLDRAECLYRLGCCRVKLSAIANAVSLFTVALELCDASGLPCDRLRAEILEWRSRCYQRQRDWEAARADVERALELAEGIGDGEAAAHVYFQAALVAEHASDWLLARFYAEEARRRYEDAGDRLSLARLENNLGAIQFLLGKPEQAVAHLERAIRTALEVGNRAEAAQALSSLAQVHLRTDSAALAEQEGLRALELLGDRVDYLFEVVSVRLVLGRALLALGRHDEAAVHVDAAEEAAEALGSDSHRSAVWVARGDVARACGDVEAAADSYRRAAEVLQDIHF